MRIGLVGAGNISATHARALASIDEATLVAVYGPTRDRAEALASGAGAAAYDSLDAMLDRERLDIAIVGTPSGLHGEHGAAAARRGVHVLVEKPIEITARRADALAAEARRAGVTLGVIFQDRLKPDVRALKSLVDERALGDRLVVGAQVPWWRPPEYYRQSRWRGTWALDGGGALMNQGIHTVDLLQWLCGPAVRVFGKTSTHCHDIEVEDTAVAVIEFASGALATLQATTCAFPGRPRRIEISGATGTAILDGDRLLDRAGQRRGPGESTEQTDGSAAARPENAASAVVTDASAHRAVIVDFIDAVRRGTAPCCDACEGRRSVQLVEAIYESSRTGQPVDIR